jgi:hypothetical protein
MATHVWARASFDRELLVPLAPDGYEPVVEVFLHGRAEAIVPSFVENRKDGWLRIQATDKQPGDDRDEKWHHTHSLSTPMRARSLVSRSSSARRGRADRSASTSARPKRRVDCRLPPMQRTGRKSW